MGKNAPINGQLGIQDASSNCPCFCFSAFSPWTLKAGSQGKALFWGEEKWEGRKGNTSLITTRRRRVFLFFCDSCELRNLGKRKGGLFDEIDRFLRFETAMEIRNIIWCLAVPFDYDRLVHDRLIPLRARRDLYYLHDCTILSYRLGYEYYYIHLSNCNSCIHDKSNYQSRQAWFVPLG